MLGDTYTIADMDVWGWARLIPKRHGRGRMGPSSRISKRLAMKSARDRPPSGRRTQDKHKFKTEMDSEALHAMFPHLKEKVA